MISRSLALAIGALAVWSALAGTMPAKAQGNEQNSSLKGGNPEPVTLKIGSNLVVVRVVVRDAQGKPVENLRKEDFRLFDSGKEQAISQFAVEGPAFPVATVAAHGAGLYPTATVTAPPPPTRFLAFYFDDLNMSPGDLSFARAAAEQSLDRSVLPGERIGIFTVRADRNELYR